MHVAVTAWSVLRLACCRRCLTVLLEYLKLPLMHGCRGLMAPEMTGDNLVFPCSSLHRAQLPCCETMP